MDFKEYQELAQRTTNRILVKSEHIINGALGLCGEAGEVMELLWSDCETLYKNRKVAEELGDVLWYCAELNTWLHGEIHDLECDSMPLLNESVGLCIAAARVADMVKKATMQGHEMSVKQIGDAVASVVRIVDELARKYGFTLDYIERENIAKLKRRYPYNFDPNRSVNREV